MGLLKLDVPQPSLEGPCEGWGTLLQSLLDGLKIETRCVVALWEELLSKPGEEVVIPWVGGRQVSRDGRFWDLKQLPPEYGWFSFGISGNRNITLKGPADPDLSFAEGLPLIRGYIVGNRMIPDNARVPTEDKFAEETLRLFLVEEGLPRIARGTAVRTAGGQHVYLQTEFNLGPEDEVVAAYQDRKSNLDEIKGVTPALDLAFRWMTRQRELQEEFERKQEAERLRRAEEEAKRLRLEAALRSAGTGVGRRELAATDFKAAAKAALAVTGSELLDVRYVSQTQAEVSYRYRKERLACIVDRKTLRIIDAGICLTDHYTGVKGDTLFTLESLPSVVEEALQRNKLVIWRHA